MMLIEKGGANHFNLCDTMQDTTPTEEKTEAASNRKSESYRDRISTVDQKGKRIWIYPKKPKGRLYNSRTLFSFFLLAILFAGPFIKISGQPILLLNFLERKFIIFGLAFWPQDFHLFALAMLTFIVFIVLFTAVFGRLFCGWACPQSVFMELVFRKIEYWIEGDARKQRALNEGPLTEEKVLKKGLKHAIFFAIAFLIGNTFMAYIVGIDQVKTIVSQPPWEHWSGFLAVSFFSLLFYANFAFFREQACVIVCPYGRFQSVLLDPSSIVVSYDFKRGEPRGKRSKKNPDAELGDCIDCHLCVDVCPTGIDIRNGTQLECINCTACIDACNDVMQKVKRPEGLIRYASYNSIIGKTQKLFTPRAIGYSVVLTLLIVLVGTMLLNRNDVETTILRTPGSLYQTTETGHITNLYSVRLVNKKFETMEATLRLASPEGQIKMVGGDLQVPEDGHAETAFFVEIAKDQLSGMNTHIVIEVVAGGEVVDEVETSFIGPAK